VVVTISAVVTALIGALVTGLGAFFVVQERNRRRRGVHATGVVVDNVHGPGHILVGQSIDTTPSAPVLDKGWIKVTPQPRAMGFPVVEFKASSGEVVRFRSSHGKQPPAHKVGDAVALYYDAADPRKAELAGEGSFVVAVFFVLGGIFLAVSAALWVFAR
jgi:hypothetical protein